MSFVAIERRFPLDQPAWKRAIKRGSDVVSAVGLLVAFSPLLVLAGIAIKLNDGGSITFRQVRVGRHGERFTMYKLRTMVEGAEHQVVDLRDRNQRQGPLFKLAHDPRVTRIGRFLRVTSIDELPQLINVVAGHMSLVGPRPAMPTEVLFFTDELHDRHYVRPGISGLWQIVGRDNPSFSLYKQLDLYYVRNWGILLDLTILAMTAQVVVLRSFKALRSGEFKRSVID